MSWNNQRLDVKQRYERNRKMASSAPLNNRKVSPFALMSNRKTQFYGPMSNTVVPGNGTVRIADLSIGFSDVKIVGVIIGKEEPRSLPNKKDPTVDRHVISFTLRDSEVDFINVTIWGSQQYIQDMAASIQLGQVVELENVGVQNKPVDGSAEKFHVRTPVPYTLVASESRSHIAPYDGWDRQTLEHLIHVPAKPSNDYYTIADIMVNGKTLDGQLISILTVIRSVGDVRRFKSKTGRELKRREVKVFDNTAPSFTLVLWDEELISLADSWVPKDHVIFAADVKVTFDEYKKTMIATATCNTIITTNPGTTQAGDLYHYAQGAELPDELETVGMVTDTVPLDSITNVYNIEQVDNLMNSSEKEYGITYTFIKDFNIDVDDSQCIVTKCSKCRRKVDSRTGSCTNVNCPKGTRTEETVLDTNVQYKISLSLSDHTGTLYSCPLTDEAAQKMINSSVEEFMFMDDKQRTQVKWKYLLERCKVHFRVDPPVGQWPKPTLRILSCVTADPGEAISFMQ